MQTAQSLQIVMRHAMRGRLEDKASHGISKARKERGV